MTTGTSQDAGAQAAGPLQTTDAPRWRASDADRTATIEVLQDAMARGLLTHDEGGDRMAAAFAARFQDELPGLTADLPPAVAAPAPEAVAGWRHLLAALAGQVRYEVRSARAAGLRSRRFLVVALVALLLLGGVVAVVGLAAHGLFDGGGLDGGRFGGAGFDGRFPGDRG